jgi:tryptophan 2,3-dioxygenase
MIEKPVRYDEYLKISDLLNLQDRISEQKGRPAHDEMLFIIIHQVYELWFKQILFELDRIQHIFSHNPVPDADLQLVNRGLERINEIMRILVQQVSVIETMTPFDFLDFRNDLYPASGFQSLQFRILETRLGLSSQKRVQFAGSSYLHHLPADQKTLIEKEMQKPSLKESLEKWLERTPFVSEGTFDFWSEYFKSVQKLFQEDMDLVKRNPRLTEAEKQASLNRLEVSLQQFKSLESDQEFAKLNESGFFEMSRKAILSALFIMIYSHQPILHNPHQMMDHLQDLDESLTQWRSRHALMAHRMIGSKIGTGGSSGADYLSKTASQQKMFSDFFNLSTFLIPRSRIPKLPEHLKKKMGFSL